MGDCLSLYWVQFTSRPERRLTLLTSSLSMMLMVHVRTEKISLLERGSNPRPEVNALRYHASWIRRHKISCQKHFLHKEPFAIIKFQLPTVVGWLYLKSSQPIKIMPNRSVYLTTLFLDRLSALSTVTSTCHIHSPETDNCPS